MSKVQRRINRKLRKSFQKNLERIPAVVGDHSGRVEVPGWPNQTRLRVGERGVPMVLRNVRSSRTVGTRVWIGRNGDDAEILQVLGGRSHSGEAATSSPNVSAHALSHYLTGGDTVYISTRQIVEFLLTVVSGLTVKVNGGYCRLGDQPVYVNTQQIDLTPSLPVAGARWVVLSIAADKSISATLGTPVGSYADLTESDIPVVPEGQLSLWLVRLYTGQTVISESATQPDFFDLRYALFRGGILGHHASHESGGDDEISVDGLMGLLADPQNAGQIGGKPVDLTGLADGDALLYDLAGDQFVPGPAGGMVPHHLEHESGGTDEISVEGLHGVLADAQNANRLLGVGIEGSVSLGQTLRYTGFPTKWRPVDWPASGREVLTADRTYYVNATTGNDINSGLTALVPVQTIQRAVDIVSGLDINGHTVTIQVDDGTYNETVTLKDVVGYSEPGCLLIQGNVSSPANVHVIATGESFFSNSIQAVWDISGMKLDATGSCLYANDATLRYGTIIFGTAVAHLQARNGGQVIRALGGTCWIAGNATYHILALGGAIQTSWTTEIFLANVSISYYAYVRQLGVVTCNNMTFTLGGYTCTGTKYSIVLNGVTYGASANYFPGSAAGVTATGGQLG